MKPRTGITEQSGPLFPDRMAIGPPTEKLSDEESTTAPPRSSLASAAGRSCCFRSGWDAAEVPAHVVQAAVRRRADDRDEVALVIDADHQIVGEPEDPAVLEEHGRLAADQAQLIVQPVVGSVKLSSSVAGTVPLSVSVSGAYAVSASPPLKVP